MPQKNFMFDPTDVDNKTPKEANGFLLEKLQFIPTNKNTRYSIKSGYRFGLVVSLYFRKESFDCFV